MRPFARRRIVGLVGLCILVAGVLIGVLSPCASACVACNDAGCIECTYPRVPWLYGNAGPGKGPGGPVDDSCAPDKDRYVLEWVFTDGNGNPKKSNNNRYQVLLKYGCGTSDKLGHTSCGPFSLCFTKTDTSDDPDGEYQCDNPLVKAKVQVTSKVPKLIPAGGGYTETGGVILKTAEGITISTKTHTEEHLSSEQVGQDLYTRTFELHRWGEDGDFLTDAGESQRDYPTSIVQQRGQTTIRSTYFKYTESSGQLVRKRVTEAEVDSSGSSTRYLTTLYGYYGSGDYAGRLKFIVRPEGVARCLADKGYQHGINPADVGAVCNLDNWLNDENDLMPYAETTFDAYDAQGRVTQLTSRGGGCCGSSGAGQYTFAYGANANYPGNPAEDEQWNQWKTYRRITAPSGLRTVEFYNQYDQIIFKVDQKMSGTSITQRWVTHSKYYTDSDGFYKRGCVKEQRSPSACTGYGFTDSAAPDALGWTTDVSVDDTGSEGLVRLYDYDNNSEGKLASEKVRHGTSGSNSQYWVRKYTYTSNTYNGRTVYLVNYETVYPSETTDDAATDRQTTGHAYTFYDSSNAVACETVTYPTVPSNPDHHGSGSGTLVKHHYNLDTTHNLYYEDWTQREDGTYAYTELGIGTWDFGQVTKSIEDANSNAGDVSGFPTGWSARTTGLHLKTTYAYYDATGSLTRLKSVTAPDGRKTVYAYLCQKQTAGSPTKETTTSLVTLVTPHMDASGHYDYAPVQISVTDLDGRTLISASGDSNDKEDGDLADDWTATGTTLESAFGGSITSKTVSTYNDAAQLTSTNQYYDLASSKKLTTSYSYNETTGLLEKVTAPDGTISYTVYDQLSRTTAAWMGTDATGASQSDPDGSGAPNNLKKVSETYYDQATPGSGSSGIGDGNVTQTKTYYTDNDAYSTVYKYDGRDRLEQSRGPDNVAVKRTLDNLGRATTVETYADSDTDFVIDDVSGVTELRAKSEAKYDEKGQVWQTIVYNVDPSDGTVGHALTGNYWYDARGRLIKTADPNGLFTKTAYDGAGRTTAAYLSYDSAEISYADADDVSGDTVIEQTTYAYDSASNVTLTTRYQRTDTATLTGSLAASWAQADSRRTYAAAWFDELSRTVRAADYGTSGDTALTDYDPGTGGTQTYDDCKTNGTPAPNTSDNVVVAKYVYDAATGRMTDVYDNKNTRTVRSYDDLGRVTKVVENYDDGTASETDFDKDRTTQYVFDSKGRLAYLKAVNAKGSGNGTEDQKTYYVYGDTVSAARPTKVIYPDTQDQVSGDNANDGYIISVTGSDHVAITYDRLGRTLTRTDQRGTVHTYAFDTAGRLEKDRVTTVGTGVDDYVESIKYAFDDVGRTSAVTSYGSNDCTTDVRSGVLFTFDGWGGVAKSNQDHAAAADSGDPAVEYTYDDGASGSEAKYVRLSKVKYPGPATRREVFYRYGSAGGTGDVLNRLDNMADDSSGTTKYAEYTYLGAGAIVKVSHPAVTGGLDLTYKGASNGAYTGLDRFGRVVDQKWQDTAGTPVVKDRYRYGYDRASNRTWRENTLRHDAGGDPKLDEYYTYDGLQRLTNMDRGTLTGGPPYTGISGAPAKEEDYTLEALGNWKAYVKKTAGTTDLSQTRTHNPVNEMTGITGGSWIVPAYDAAGNMTSGPKPGAETTRIHMKYDAWNRQVKVSADNGNGEPGTVIAEYRYDGLNHRIVKLVPNGENWDRTDFYYNEAWQCLEERYGANQAKETVPTIAKIQWLWSVQYIDAPVVRWRDGNCDGDLDGGSQEGDNTLYYTNDANMNVTTLVDASDGAVVERYSYDPYGKATVRNGVRDAVGNDTSASEWSERTSNTFDNAILYCGYRFDNESGLYNPRNRYYHPTFGDWTSRDPAGDMVPDHIFDSFSLKAVETARTAAFDAIYGGAIGAQLDRLRWLTTGGMLNMLANAPVIAVVEDEVGRLAATMPLTHNAWPLASYHGGLNLYEYGRSRALNVRDPTGLKELSWSERILAKLNNLPGLDYLECVCKCVNAGNEKAAKYVEQHAKEAAAIAAAEAAAAAASTPLQKGFAPPGQEQTTSLATKIAVRTGMGSVPTAYAAMRVLGRFGHYGVAGTAIAVGLAELGLEGWCTYMCARDSNFRL